MRRLNATAAGLKLLKRKRKKKALVSVSLRSRTTQEQLPSPTPVTDLFDVTQTGQGSSTNPDAFGRRSYRLYIHLHAIPAKRASSSDSENCVAVILLLSKILADKKTPSAGIL